MSKGRILDKRIVLLAIALFAVIIISTFTFAIPDRNWQIRTDLVVGDYYTLESDRYVEIREVVEINDDLLVVKVTAYNVQTKETRMDEVTQTKQLYLNGILLNDQIYDSANVLGVLFKDTNYGSKFCKIYALNLNKYYTDEYSVIYYSSIGGNYWSLADTSLFIGKHETKYEMPLELREVFRWHGG